MRKSWRKYRLVTIMFLSVILVMLSLFRIRTLEKALWLPEKNIGYCTIEKMYEEQAYEETEPPKAVISDREAAAELWNALGQSKMRFQELWLSSTAAWEGAEFYVVRFALDPWQGDAKWIWFASDGRVYFDKYLFRMQEESRQRCIELLEDTMQKYDAEA